MKADNTFILGAYPQTSAGTDWTAIHWRILRKTDFELFVLSEYILDCRRYHGEIMVSSWQVCDLRKWLNEDFYITAFDARERAKILTARCTGNGADSPDTEDKVFLLSVEEVKTFTDPGDGLLRRRAIATDFARLRKPDGCSFYVYDKGVERDYITENGARQGCSWWWTRTRFQGDKSPTVAFIGPRSTVKTYGLANLARYGVRPAMRVRLK